MENNNFDSKITDLTKQIGETKENMDEIAKKFIRETEEFVIMWSKDNIESKVKNNPEITKNLGLDKLRELKSKCRNLIQEMPSIVKTKFDNFSIWSHEMSISDLEKESDFRFDYEHKLEKGIDELLRQILGHVGVLLTEYEYIKYTPGSVNEWDKTSDGFRYAYGFFWSNGMKETKKEYLNKNEKFLDLIKELNSTKIKKEEAEAEDLWNQV